MPAAPLRPDESEIQEALRSLEVMDTGPEAEFDALARAAALVCEVPVSLITLLDTERQWFKANVGLPGVTQTPRDAAFCAHAVLQDDIFEVPDAKADPRFAANPLVLGTPNIRFYAGAPVRLSGGEAVGTLCVIDRMPRSLGAQQRAVLNQLAIAASRALEARRSVAQSRALTARLAVSEARFHELSGDSPLGTFHATAQGEITFASDRLQDILGLGAVACLGDGWLAAVHPQDQEAITAEWREATGRGGKFDREVRLFRADLSQREIHVRAAPVRNDAGQAVGYVGSVEDVTERVQLAKFLDRTGRLALVGGWEVDLGNSRITWSAQTRRIHGVDASYEPTLEKALDFFEPEAREALAAAIHSGIEEGTPWDLELPMVTAKGAHKWVRAMGSVERDRGRPIRLIGALQDLTAQRQKRPA